MAIAQPKASLTSAEYLAIERGGKIRHEFLGGEMFAMAGASRAHNLLVTRFVSRLHAEIENRGCEVYSSDMRVKVETAEFYTYPDIVVVCGERHFDSDPFLDTLINPAVLIEVLSPSTIDYDRGRRFEYYQAIPSLAEVLFVAQDRPRIERQSRQINGDWLLHTVQGLAAEIEILALGVRFSMSDLYLDILSA